MRRILVILSVLFVLFVLVGIASAVLPYRQDGGWHKLRVAVTLAALGLGVAWVVLSTCAVPRAARALRQARRADAPRAERLLAGATLGAGLAPLVAIAAALLAVPGCCTIRMPGRSHGGALPPLSPGEEALSRRLRADVEVLSGAIGERNAVMAYSNLCAAADFIEASFAKAGFAVARQDYVPTCWVGGKKSCRNLEVEIRGSVRPDEIVVIGAHYDSAEECPAANDNASGVAALLALARSAADWKAERTLRFVAFANEEPPFFMTRDMGSVVYAARCRERRENVVAMLSLETLGCYSDSPGSQHYPSKLFALAFPTAGNFVAFIGNTESSGLVSRTIATFRGNAAFPSEGAALPGIIVGVGWSDHWGFWKAGYPGIMVTDTAPFRYAFYHTAGDTPDRLDYDRMARVVNGVQAVVADLAGVSLPKAGK